MVAEDERFECGRKVAAGQSWQKIVAGGTLVQKTLVAPQLALQNRTVMDETGLAEGLEDLYVVIQITHIRHTLCPDAKLRERSIPNQHVHTAYGPTGFRTFLTRVLPLLTSRATSTS